MRAFERARCPACGGAEGEGEASVVFAGVQMSDVRDLVGHHRANRGRHARGQPLPHRASKKARYTISLPAGDRRNRSRQAGPCPWVHRTRSPFSTASHGIRRRSAASASRARVSSFSFTSSCWCAALPLIGRHDRGCLHGELPVDFVVRGHGGGNHEEVVMGSTSFARSIRGTSGPGSPAPSRATASRPRVVGSQPVGVLG